VSLEELLERLEVLIAQLEELDEPIAGQVFELLDGIDILHRVAVTELAAMLDPATLAAVRDAHPAVAWLFEAYEVTVAEPAFVTPPPGATVLQVAPQG
jgi:hypothetical protein